MNFLLIILMLFSSALYADVATKSEGDSEVKPSVVPVVQTQAGSEVQTQVDSEVSVSESGNNHIYIQHITGAFVGMNGFDDWRVNPVGGVLGYGKTCDCGFEWSISGGLFMLNYMGALSMGYHTTGSDRVSFSFGLKGLFVKADGSGQDLVSLDYFGDMAGVASYMSARLFMNKKWYVSLGWEGVYLYGPPKRKEVLNIASQSGEVQPTVSEPVPNYVHVITATVQIGFYF